MQLKNNVGSHIEKIVLNMGLGDAKVNKNSLKQAQEELSIISGQRPVITRAKKQYQILKLEKVILSVLGLH